jgi:hypothetical protein
MASVSQVLVIGGVLSPTSATVEPNPNQAGSRRDYWQSQLTTSTPDEAAQETQTLRIVRPRLREPGSH